MIYFYLGIKHSDVSLLGHFDQLTSLSRRRRHLFQCLHQWGRLDHWIGLRWRPRLLLSSRLGLVGSLGDLGFSAVGICEIHEVLLEVQHVDPFHIGYHRASVDLVLQLQSLLYTERRRLKHKKYNLKSPRRPRHHHLYNSVRNMRRGLHRQDINCQTQMAHGYHSQLQNNP